MTEINSSKAEANPHRQTVLDSLAKIKYQSSRHLCVNTCVAIEDILQIVEGDPAIAYKWHDSTMIYFLKENEPNGVFYNSGANSFLIRKNDEENDETKKTASPAKNRTRRSKVTAEAVEQLAFEGLTFAEAAERIGTSEGNLKVYCYSNRYPEVKEAWKKGRERRVEAGLPLPDGRKKSVPVSNFSYADIPVTEAEDEAFREIEKSQQQIFETKADEIFEIRPKFRCGDRVKTITGFFDENGFFDKNELAIIQEINISVCWLGSHIEYVVALMSGKNEIATTFKFDEANLIKV